MRLVPVDMNPLMIVCGFGERVDALLGDVVPLRRAKFLADELLELGEGGRADGQLVSVIVIPLLAVQEDGTGRSGDRRDSTVETDAGFNYT